ncbi:hemerythrin [Planomonospora sphaerica]|uniref:Hemerythrin n=1 Tax=Planomonospora sphaerica TaxID=161355 RepID=A0A161LG87_9ACTN|nr:hemerythrin domain-containing protein [Planomonospora sphaerica]GAT64395.1 hemerythrin [Planomonospora sphaerica]
MSELDLTALHGMHDALRREVVRLTRFAFRAGPDPRRVLRWRQFERSLRLHFAAEDRALWPPLRRSLAHRPDRLTLLEALEAEHTALEELIDVIDELHAHPGIDLGIGGLGDLTDSLVTGLTGHLEHEEDAVLPLIRQVLTARQWARFTRLHTRPTDLGHWDAAP